MGPKGIDVSHNNGAINWHLMKDDGVEFAYIKASDGMHFSDPRFNSNVLGALDAGIKIGAYHFLRPGDDAGLQTQRFLGILKGIGFSKFALPPVVDVEDPSDDPGAWNRLDEQTRVLKVGHFLAPVDAALTAVGRGRMVIYCSPGWWTGVFGNADFSGHPLWAAAYSHPPILTGTCWKEWLLHQYDDQGKIGGVSGIDMDEWNGDLP